MAASRKNSTNSHKVAWTESEILARKANGQSRRSSWVQIHCLDPSHPHGDRNPSGSYSPETGFYRCFGCGVQGFARDRDRPDWNQEQHRTYSNGVVVTRTLNANGDKDVRQSKATSDSLPLPYCYEDIHGVVRTIYLVEGEKCADALRPELDLTCEAVITSKGGAKNPQGTDWSPVIEAIKTGAEVVFIPDCDEPGYAYANAVAALLGLEIHKVISLYGKTKTHGKDIADWLETHSIDDLPDAEQVEVEPNWKTTTPGREKSDGKPISKEKSSVYKREISKTLDELIAYNATLEQQTTEWLATGFIARGQTTVIYGQSSAGKSTVIRKLLYDTIIRQIDPFCENGDRKLALSVPRGKVILVSVEEQPALTKPKFQAVGMEDSDYVHLNIHLADDADEIDTESEEYIRKSPYTQLIELIDRSKQSERPYQAIVIDPLGQFFGDQNKAHVIDETWDRLSQPLERRGLAVILIAHPRKDSPADSPIRAALKGSERLLSRPRIVALIQSGDAKSLKKYDDARRESKEKSSSKLGHLYPSIKQLEEKTDFPGGTVGAVISVKRSDGRPEDRRAWQFSLSEVELDNGGNAPKLSGVRVSFAAAPLKYEQNDTKNDFEEFVYDIYRIQKLQKQSQQEKLAADQRQDRRDDAEDLESVLTKVFSEKSELSSAELAEAIENAGFSAQSGQTQRVKRRVASYDPKTHKWSKKAKF